jgi:shikimate dehydrogenase
VADPTAATKVAGIIGWPVEHSLSPAIHNAAFHTLALDWVYVALPVPPGNLPKAVAGLKALGIAGANVTMPHKEEAVMLVDVLAPEAARLRAVNTLVLREDSLVGYNTDAPGFHRFITRDAGFEPAGKAALLIGAGGAARACALALAEGGLARLVVSVRTPARTRLLTSALEGQAVTVDTVSLAGAEASLGEVDLVVNATPVGLAGERLPLAGFRPEQTVVDLVYVPPVTPLLEDARAAGARALGGLGMLLHQAALAVELWTGRLPPLSVMSAAALAELSALEHEGSGAGATGVPSPEG